MSTAVQTMSGLVKTLKNYSESTGIVGVYSLDDAVRSVSVISSLSTLRDNFVKDVTSTEKFPDVNQRLQEVCGITLGGEDVGAVTSATAGGSVVKTAESIVPEDGKLTDAPLPTPGTTTPITYTGDDGKSFTFYVQWPESFTAAYNCESQADYLAACDLIGDSRYFTDFSQNGLWDISGEDLKNGVTKILCGLNGWWLRESAKLNYDSYGLALDGQTVRIQLAGGGGFTGAAAATDGNAKNGTSSNVINLAINLEVYYGIDAENANGLRPDSKTYLDRVIAHELTHGVMNATGTLKEDTPEFFREGIAEFVIGASDNNAGHVESITKLAQDSDTLKKNLAFADGYLNTDAYPAGYMFLRYLCKQAESTSMYVGEQSAGQTFDFNGNNTVISNYAQGNTINYNTSFFSAYSTADGKDFVLGNDDGNLLVVRNAADKNINFNIGGTQAVGYMTSQSGSVGDSNAGNYTVLLGANYKANEIHGGKNGGFLWGGLGGNDNLYGGAGADTFYYSYGDGKDNIFNADSNDLINLAVTLDKISSAQISDNGVNINLVDGGSLNVSGQAGYFRVQTDNATTNYQADYQNKTWKLAGS